MNNILRAFVHNRIPTSDICAQHEIGNWYVIKLTCLIVFHKISLWHSEYPIERNRTLIHWNQ